MIKAKYMQAKMKLLNKFLLTTAKINLFIDLLSKGFQATKIVNQFQILRTNKKATFLHLTIVLIV